MCWNVARNKVGDRLEQSDPILVQQGLDIFRCDRMMDLLPLKSLGSGRIKATENEEAIKSLPRSGPDALEQREP